MKKITTLLFICLAFNRFNSNAQTILNPDFELVNSDGSMQYWGNVYLFPVWIDSAGISHTDSILFDGPYLYAPTNDAYTGSHALELTNAWNFTTNTGIAGAVGLDDDTVFTSWGAGTLIPTNATSFNPFAPINFGFHYKFYPVNGDSAFARIALWDSLGNQIAEGNMIITDPENNYTGRYELINYSSAGFAAYYSFFISNFYTADPGVRQPGFGTRLTVDNIGFDFASSTGAGSIIPESEMNVYPNPAHGLVSLNFSRNEKEGKVTVSNVLGEIIYEVSILKETKIELNLNNFSAGIYFIQIFDGEKNYCRKIIVEQD